ncbi:MAG TPA: GNAT family N-acetyltransferase [Sinorhizobium sp.]|nr:GNAT family N-acetyltransferase [Sinorhizobium sp.]
MANPDFILAPLDNAEPALAGTGDVAGLAISVHSDMAELEAAWRALDGNSLNSLHQSYDWCAAWTKIHGGQYLFVRGMLDGRTLFILPLEIARGRFFRTARLIGSAHSNLNTGLFAAASAAAPCVELAPALLQRIRGELSGFADITLLEKTPAVWRGAPHPLSALPGFAHPNASFQLPLLGDMERTLTQLNAKHRRKKMRNSEKRLADLGGYDCVIAREPSEAHALLDVFFRQKAARFAAQGLPDVFADPATRAFFHALIDSRSNDVPLLELNAMRMKGAHDGKIISVTGLLRKGDHVICQFGSIDDEFAACSPGEVLFYRVIERLCREGVKIFDFGIGDQQYKRSWCTIETPLWDIILPLTPRGYLAAGVHRAILHAKRAIKANRPLYAFIQRQRRHRQETSRTGAD